MNRKAHCQACANAASGVKTRIAVEHTCGQYEINLTPDQHKCVCLLWNIKKQCDGNCRFVIVPR